MTPSMFFTLINIVSAAGWILIIIISRFWKGADTFLVCIVVALLAAAYSWFNFAHINEAGGPGGFSTFEGVTKIFSNPWLIDAAWAHIVGIDLIIGMLIKNNAAKHGMPYGLVVIILLVTIVFTPLGLLLYLLARWIKTKQYFESIC
ncbi:MAG: abscisic acid-deficient protein Aba4 family protein [Bacteroidota bacterium]